MKTAVEFRSVTKRFLNAGYDAVSDVSIKIFEGEIVTILGTSGCGKTTLLKMVNRLQEPDTGEILFYNQSIKDINPVELRRRIGYVIQQVGLFPHMTVSQNIGVVPEILKWDKERIANRINELLDLVQLSPEEFSGRYPRQLSGGQQQKIGLARALAADPPLLLMDEPFGAIDAITRKNLQGELLKINEKLGKTMLFVTHDIYEALRLGNRVLIMDKGKVQQFDKPSEICKNPANDFVKQLVASVYDGQSHWFTGGGNG